MSTVVDRRGFSFDYLLAIQTADLAKWEKRLKAPTYVGVREYIRSTNEPATDPLGVHRVFRGQDMVQIIMEWPDLSPCYPAIIPDCV